MTAYDYIKSIINNGTDMNENSAEKLIYLAYYIGREEAAKQICDDCAVIFEEQRERARECRYSNMAMRVQGNHSGIYSADYAGDMITEFGRDEVN